MKVIPIVPEAEVDRRYKKLRSALEEEGLDALLVCGNQYTGFEGAVRYVSGFEIVHRYCYVLLPLEGEPTLIFPREARWIGDKKKPWIEEKVWPDVPGEWIRDRGQDRHWNRVGVYGMDHIMTVEDYRPLSGADFELVEFDRSFDLARAVKSDWELERVRDSMELIQEGFWAILNAFEPGKSEEEVMAPSVKRFVEGGSGPRIMNIILSGTEGEAEAHFKIPGDRVIHEDDLLLYSLEVTDRENYWTEFSRAITRAELTGDTKDMATIYPEALNAARRTLTEGTPASEVHQAFADIFDEHGFQLGHLSGHGIGTSMIEHPAIGADEDIVLEENMILSFHPQIVDKNGEICLYTQDTFRVGQQEGEDLAEVPWKIFDGTETRESVMSEVAASSS